MKKRIWGALLIASLAPTAAQSSTHRTFDGPYLGVSAGGSLTTGRLNTTRNASLSIPDLDQSFTINTVSQNNLKRNGPTVGLFAGYGVNLDPVYLGLEFFFKESHSRTTLSGRETLTQIFPGHVVTVNITTNTVARLRDGEFGFDLRPGILLTSDGMLYGRVGAAFNKLSLNSNLSFSAQNPGNLTTTSLSLSQANRKSLMALRLGAGLEQKIYSHWTIRSDYIYTRYRKIRVNNTIAASFFDPLVEGDEPVTTSFSNAASAKISSHTVMLGITYYW